MGLNIALLNCNGEVLDTLEDPHNYLHRLLPALDEESESMLAKIDWYGDTFFNYLQMKRFLVEWDQVSQQAQTSEERVLVEAIKNLGIRCQNERDILKFIGD